jgi:hypothetical protein
MGQVNIHEAVQYLSLILIAEGNTHINNQAIGLTPHCVYRNMSLKPFLFYLTAELFIINDCDLRRTLLHLQFWKCNKKRQKEAMLSTYALLQRGDMSAQEVNVYEQTHSPSISPLFSHLDSWMYFSHYIESSNLSDKDEGTLYVSPTYIH